MTGTIPLLQLLALISLLAMAVTTDLKARRIPNAITLPGLLVGLSLGALEQGGLPSQALLGAGLALVAGFPLFALGALGAGDVKLFAAVGAFVGPGGLLSVLVYGGVAGGVITIVSAVKRGALLGLLSNTMNLLHFWISRGRAGERVGLHQDGAHTIPYGLAIAAGAILTWFAPLSFGGLL